MKKDIEFIGLYTGSNGKKGCTSNCIGCAQTRYGDTHCNYQGTLLQIDEIIRQLPNLKKVAIFGNPDISVDPYFCNMAAKRFIEHGIMVRFSTSGVGGVEIIKKVLNGLDVDMIEYVNYSIDTIDLEKAKWLKGRKINLKDIKDAINYCKNNRVAVHLQPTIWEENKSDIDELINYFKNVLEVSDISAHFGSLEGLYDTTEIHHVAEDYLRNVYNKMIAYGAYIPKILLNDDELEEYKSFTTPCSNNDSSILEIYLEQDGIKATYCPLLASRHPEYMFSLTDEEINAPLRNICECPISSETLGYKTKKLTPICRYYPVLKK